MKVFTIYLATNLCNGKVYIGFTSNWPKRVNNHRSEANYSRNKHKPLYKAMLKYGWENFSWCAIYQSLDFEHTLKVMEPYFIKQYNSWVGCENSNGYNLTKGGEGVMGYVRTKSVIEKHRQKMKGRRQSKEHITRRIESSKRNPNFGKHNIGRKQTPESIEKTRKGLIGKKKSEEHKANMKKRYQDTTTLTCPHCGKTGDYKNMKRWHFDMCKNNPNKIDIIVKEVVCSVCGFTAKSSPNFYRYHELHCKYLTKP